MARPSLSIPSVDLQAVQTAAGIGFESVHDFLGTYACFHDHMHVIGSHMCRPEIPTAVETNLAQSIEYSRPAVPVEAIGRLVHRLAFHSDALRGAGPRNRIHGRANGPHNKRKGESTSKRAFPLPLLYSRGSA